MISTNQQNPQAVTAVKGHLVTKSSGKIFEFFKIGSCKALLLIKHLYANNIALATDSCKLEKQFLTAQNMASHYKRVLNAKRNIKNNFVFYKTFT